MRITTGRLRGRTLPFSRRRHGDIRVTSSRLKEAVFARLGPLDGLHWLDLCAGTGQVGLEAYSRGAEVISVEPDRRRASSLKSLLAEWRIGDGIDLRATRAEVVLKELSDQGASFDFIYVDPPYHATRGGRHLCAALLEDVAASGILTEGGLVLVQHDRRQPLPESHPPLHRQDERLYGDSLLSVYALVDGPQADGAMADEALDDDTPEDVEDESHRDGASGG
ncbi:MAG: RsmD family RNA methyltransferase [Candidatus Latescibacterota bacterium]|nr:RsmD family RNA methyltransferase [Candidatus Latescibacterota bacterium]